MIGFEWHLRLLGFRHQEPNVRQGSACVVCSPVRSGSIGCYISTTVDTVDSMGTEICDLEIEVVVCNTKSKMIWCFKNGAVRSCFVVPAE